MRIESNTSTLRRNSGAPGLPRWFALSLCTLAIASLTGCASYFGIDSKARPLTAGDVGLTADARAKTGGAPTATFALPAAWWGDFGDAQLNALEERALANSPTLRMAQTRIARAQAGVDAVSGANQPQLEVGLDMSRQLFTANSIYPPPLGGNIYNTGTLQGNFNWELDFFGKNRAALDAALGQASAAQADAAAAQVLLSSNIARSYFNWQRIRAQIVVAERTLEQRENISRLVKDRVNAGLDTQLELKQSHGAIPEAKLQIEQLREQEGLARNALAALVAQQNTPLALESTDIAAIKQIALPNEIPADLLGRRPDIAAARARVEAATQDVSHAKTLFYPNINLVAFAGYSSIGFDQMLTSSSEQWGVGPSISLPIFDGGHLRANLRGKTADLDAAIETYNTQVIDAIHDVADQLVSVKAIAQQQEQQARAQAAAQAAYDIAVQRYDAGIGNFLNVLNAESALIAQQRQGVDLAARTLDTQVQLIRSLGGPYTSSHAATIATSAATPSSQTTIAQP